MIAESSNWGKHLELAGMTSVAFDILPPTRKTDLEFGYTFGPEEIQLRLAFSDELIETRAVESLLDLMQQTLEAVTSRSCELSLGSLATLSDNTLAVAPDLEDRPDRDESPLALELFLQRALATPDARAMVTDAGGDVSYGQLAASGIQLAERMVKAGVGPEQPVFLRIERSVEFVVAAIATNLAGGYYVPIDPELPSDRFELLCERVKGSSDFRWVEGRE